MKFFVAFAALVVVAFATPVVKPVNNDLAELEAIIAAIQSPSTNPATAQLLEEMLAELLGVGDVVAGPAIVDPLEPIHVGPEIVDFPLPDGGEVSAPVEPSPVVIGPMPEGATSPLVQVIVNVNQAAAPAPVPVGPVVEGEPVQVVDVAAEPVQVVDVAAEPVQVVDVAPIVVEPVVIGTPVLPSPAITLPEELN